MLTPILAGRPAPFSSVKISNVDPSQVSPFAPSVAICANLNPVLNIGSIASRKKSAELRRSSVTTISTRNALFKIVLTRMLGFFCSMEEINCITVMPSQRAKPTQTSMITPSASALYDFFATELAVLNKTPKISQKIHVLKLLR